MLRTDNRSGKITDQGRNVIPVNNSKGQTLLENWVEERQVKDIDPAVIDGQSRAQQMKDGHSGLMSVRHDGKVDGPSTYVASYKGERIPHVSTKGIREQMLEQAIYAQISQEVHSEFNAPPENEEMKSITHRDYFVAHFEPTKEEPTAGHDYRLEQPVSYWTEHRDTVQGVTQTRPQFDTVFRKNTAFSKPIEEYWEPDESKPYERNHVPHM